ncbi:polysaccharide biosynthesis tyrosine autokinase [Elizabethkingia anophelis]|uniref:non-specific protein-tyrosine kinase n=1 Tax=Elizabethkingia anophelis TaxID=1117645 RepID=A0AAU8VGI7_9FLAO|nr:polysaccharide biosynthesis tyrosine autokinase [Elizabethkingia anophelis]AQX02255.1 hypothetical protein BBD32_12700 [Elizabethkingia anophelis]OPB63775.1 hypothetical protein BAY11_16870 [Elizabethkingia anophelis]
MIRNSKYINIRGTWGENFHILDLFKYALGYWYWLVLSCIFFGGYYYYRYSKSLYVYRDKEVVMIKKQSSAPITSAFLQSAESPVNIKDEMLQLQSKELLRQVIPYMGGDKSYKISKGLRDYELYTDSPVEVILLGETSLSGYSLKVEPLDGGSVLIREWQSKKLEKPFKLSLNKPTRLPFGELLVKGSPHYGTPYYGKSIRVEKLPLERSVVYFLGQLKIKHLGEDTSVLELSIEDSSSKRGVSFLKSLVAVYNALYLDDKKRIAQSTGEFIADRLKIVEGELSGVEQKIEDFKLSNQGMDAQSLKSLSLSEQGENKSQGMKIDMDISLLEMLSSYLKDADKSKGLLPSNMGLSGGNIEQQIQAYNSFFLKRNRLMEGGNNKNPVVRDLDASLVSLRQEIQRSLDHSIRGLVQRRRQASALEQRALGQMLKVPSKEREQYSIYRSHAVKENLYLYLLNKREENALNAAIGEAKLHVVDHAVISHVPISPNILISVFTGLGIGFLVWVALLLLRLFLNTTVKSREEIESALNIPFLGEIPYSRSKSESGMGVFVYHTGKDALSEAFRILRTNITFMVNSGISPQVITYTSFSAGVGKTFNTLNLAASFSYMKKRVVLVDLDLRKGTLSTRVGLEGKAGVSHYLSGLLRDINTVIYHREIGLGVDVIPLGAIAPNPVELLLSKHLDELIEALKLKYDYVIVDGVPMGIVADANIIDRISELTLFIIREGKLDRRMLAELENIYQERKLSNLGIVFNGVRIGAFGYGYGYGQELKGGLWSRFLRMFRRV